MFTHMTLQRNTSEKAPVCREFPAWETEDLHFLDKNINTASFPFNRPIRGRYLFTF